MSHERLLMPTLPTGAAHEPYQAFGLPAVYGEYLPMVEFHLRTGDRISLPYGWLTAVKLLADGISVTFTTGAQVSIKGRNLLPVYYALARQQAVFVHEANDATALLIAESSPVVENIEVKTTV